MRSERLEHPLGPTYCVQQDDRAAPRTNLRAPCRLLSLDPHPVGFHDRLRRQGTRIDVNIAPDKVDPAGTRLPESLGTGDYQAVVRDSLRELFPEATSHADRRALSKARLERTLGTCSPRAR